MQLNTSSIAGFVAEDRMIDLFVKSLFEFREEDLAFLLLQAIGSQLHDKVIRCQHAIVEQRQYDRIDNNGPEFFQDVQSQSWPPIE